MKKYNVKKVVKMEERLKELRDPESDKLRDKWLFPMGLATAMSATMTATMGTEAIMTGQPVLGAMAAATALVTAYAGRHSLKLLLQDAELSVLYEELQEIYKEQGDDFKAQVEEALENAKEKSKQL